MNSMKKALFFAATLGLLANLSAPAFAADSGASDAINDAGQTVWQTIGGDVSLAGLLDNANLDEHAFQNVTGNVGVNNAAGAMNQQTNTLYLDTTTERSNWGGSYHNEVFYSGGFLDIGEEATVEDHVFEYASGNVGANNAAGAMNQQINGAAVLESSTSRVEGATENQDLSFDVSNNIDGSLLILSGVNEANIEGNAFDHFKGNAGLNNAAGSENQQVNALLVSGNPNESELDVSLSNSINNAYSILNGSLIFTDGNTAKFTENAFNHASGNIGVNNASGNMNQQQNQAAILTTGELDDNVTVDISNSITNATDLASPLNEADFTSQAFQNANGNIGANNAAGNMNQQVNQTTIVH